MKHWNGLPLNKITAFLIFLLFYLAHRPALAQKIPSDSPKSTLIQRVGLSDITVSYGRPGARGRKIFGGLVPYGKVWRTGANYPTFIRITDTTYFGPKKDPLPPAKYALYSIPGKDKWIIILSRDTALWGAFGYKEQNDALRFEVIPDSTIYTETFSIELSELGESEATITLQWEKTKIAFPVCVQIDERVISYVKQKIQTSKEPDSWLYCQGSNYLLKRKVNAPLALEWINRSIAIDSNCVNLWAKARILAWTENYKDAITIGEKAIRQCTSGKDAASYSQYEDPYRSQIEMWQKIK